MFTYTHAHTYTYKVMPISVLCRLISHNENCRRMYSRIVRIPKCWGLGAVSETPVPRRAWRSTWYLSLLGLTRLVGFVGFGVHRVVNFKARELQDDNFRRDGRSLLGKVRLKFSRHEMVEVLS